MLIIAGIAMIVIGWLIRDLQTAGQVPLQIEWSLRWRAVSRSRPAGSPLGDLTTIACMVGNPQTPDSMLEILAEDVSSNDWIPSEVLLDQLRVWARSQLVAERALTSRQDGPNSHRTPHRPQKGQQP